MVKDKDGILQFYNEGGLAPLVRLISKPYEKILEVALSILGNCCTLKDCCKQVSNNYRAVCALTQLNWKIDKFSQLMVTTLNSDIREDFSGFKKKKTKIAFKIKNRV